ncbi:Uncharacterized MFS-type transporter, partial [hydrothermal vent metagenome]
NNYKMLFYIAFIPGVFAVISTSFLKENKMKLQKVKKHTSFFSFLNYWKESPPVYRKVVVGLLIFTLFNSSDVFLLLKAKQAGLNDTQVIGVYIFYNLIYALSAFPAGIIADKIGLKKMFIIGLVFFAVVYLGMGFSTNLYVIIGLFLLYGIYASATEGISKAWISNITSKKDTATAIGTYAGFQSIFTMLASSFAGLIWYQFGSNTSFFVTSFATGIVVIYFMFLKENKEYKSENKF